MQTALKRVCFFEASEKRGIFGQINSTLENHRTQCIHFTAVNQNNDRTNPPASLRSFEDANPFFALFHAKDRFGSVLLVTNMPKILSF